MLVFGHHKLTGVSHKKENTVCQDSFAFNKDNSMAVIAAVADGVGSEKHSDFGSKTASETAVSYCATGIQPGMKADDILGVIYQSFDQAWRAVERGARERHFDVHQCNTTLSIAVFIDGDVYYGHVGDSGIFAFFEDGKIEPVTTQQNDSEGRVYTLFSGSNKWEFGKAPKKAPSLLLCTDGVWNMFHPDRLSHEHEKYSVPLLAWYVDPEAIKVHSKYNEFQKWLESDMDEINTKSPNIVNFDDITILIMHNDQVHYNRQPESYYQPPSKDELKQAEEAEHKRLYGHLEGNHRNQKLERAPADKPRTSELLLETACKYDESYSLSIEERAALAKRVFEEILEKNKPTILKGIKRLIGRDEKDHYSCPQKIYISKNAALNKIEIQLGKPLYKDNKTYYHVIEQAAKLLANGLMPSLAKDGLSIKYSSADDKVVFNERLLPKKLSDLFWESFINYHKEKEEAILPPPDEWVKAIGNYLSILKHHNCPKREHLIWQRDGKACPWCAIDEAHTKREFLSW